MKARSACLACVAIALIVSAASAREWQDATRQYKHEADFVSYKDGKVLLKQPNGSPLSVPWEKLCAEDQTYVRELESQQESAPLAPATPLPTTIVKTASQTRVITAGQAKTAAFQQPAIERQPAMEEDATRAIPRRKYVYKVDCSIFELFPDDPSTAYYRSPIAPGGLWLDRLRWAPNGPYYFMYQDLNPNSPIAYWAFAKYPNCYCCDCCGSGGYWGYTVWYWPRNGGVWKKFGCATRTEPN